MHIQSKFLKCTFFYKKKLGYGWGKNRLSCYNICAEALLSRIIVIARLKCLGYWICNVSLKRMNSEISIFFFEFLMKVIVVQIFPKY